MIPTLKTWYWMCTQQLLCEHRMVPDLGRYTTTTLQPEVPIETEGQTTMHKPMSQMRKSFLRATV